MILPLPNAKGLPSAVFALSLNSAICNSSYNSSKSMPVISPLLSYEKALFNSSSLSSTFGIAGVKGLLGDV